MCRSPTMIQKTNMHRSVQNILHWVVSVQWTYSVLLYYVCFVRSLSFAHSPVSVQCGYSIQLIFIPLFLLLFAKHTIYAKSNDIGGRG